MAKKKDTQEESADGVLATAKTIGKAAGEIASAAGPTPHTPSAKVPKLQKKNKSRLPRRQKKALQKAAQQKGG
jgi:hypothetical protein